MSKGRRFGAAFVFSIVLAGGLFVPTPAQAALPPSICGKLSAAIDTLKTFVAQHPDNTFLKRLLEEVTEYFGANCG
jgi:hypothetical protein